MSSVFKAQSVQVNGVSDLHIFEEGVFCRKMINILVIPLSYFIGGMATASPGSTMHDFWKVFFFIQVIPFSLLLLSLVWWFIRRKKGKVIM
nr:hypothetical protein [Bacillus toyonensis]